MVRERGGTALRQISLATGGTLTLKRSGKSRGTRSVDPRSVYFLAQIAPKRGIWHQKSQKNFWGWDPKLPQQEWWPPPTPSTATRRARWRKLPRCWDLGLGNRSPNKHFHYTPVYQWWCNVTASTMLKQWSVQRKAIDVFLWFQTSCSLASSILKFTIKCAGASTTS